MTTTTRYQITCPLPPVKLSPNYRGRTLYKARDIAAYRHDCRLAYLDAMRGETHPLPGVVTVSLDFYLCRKHPLSGRLYFPRDEDNARASFKAGQDALADAGLIPGDGCKHVRQGYTRLHTTAAEHHGRACVVVTLEVEEPQEVAA